MYRIYSQIDHKRPVGHPEYYGSISEVECALRRMAASQAQKMGIASYISSIRDGKYKQYRRNVADGLTHVFLEDRPLSSKKIRRLKDVIEDFGYECNEGIKEVPEDFLAKEEGGAILCIDFFFAQDLHVEFEIDYHSADEPLGTYFFIKDRTGSFKLMIEEEDMPESEESGKASNSANIYYVYKELLNAPIGRKLAAERSDDEPNELPRGITVKQISESPLVLSGKGKSLSPETVVNHINALKGLGIPIITHTFSKGEAASWAARGVRNTNRYEIDPDFSDKIPDPVDAREMKAHVNPLLVLFVLKTTKKPLKQNDIICEIKEKYKVNINRQAVSRHIKMLLDAGEPIKKCPDGYICL